MKVLVLDPDSKIGHALVELLDQREPPIAYRTADTRTIADEAERWRAFLSGSDTGVFVVSTASVERAEGEVSPRAELSLTKRICNLANAAGASLLHISSAQVFDGSRDRYREGDPVRASTRGGKLLWRVEEQIRKRVKHHVVLRTGWVFGYEVPGTGVFGGFLESLEHGGDVVLQSSMRGAPTAASDVARVLVAMMLQLDCGADGWGTYHYCSSDVADSDEFVQTIIALSEQYGPVDPQSVRLIDVDDPGLYGIAHHPVLECRKIRDTFGIKQRPWRSAMSVLLKQIWASRAAPPPGAPAADKEAGHGQGRVR